MPFANHTPFAAEAIPGLDPRGAEVLTAVVKGTFVIEPSGRAVRAEAPVPVRLVQVLHDAKSRADAKPPPGEAPRPEEASSVRYPSDVCVAKVGTDLVVVGEAFAARPAKAVDVGVRVGERHVHLRVHGHRVYYRSATRVKVGPAAPFERMPIVYERAYGGSTSDFSQVEHRNPVGVGVAARAADLVDRPAPQVEDPAAPINGADDRPAPAGCGAILMHWSPRREFAGTYDDAWRRARAPLLPLDYDLRAHSVAHPSLWFADPLPAGTPVLVLGMTAEPLAFTLPALPIVIRARHEASGGREVVPWIDTVLIEPTAGRVEVVARQSFTLGRGRDVLREVAIELAPGAA